jgi:hypothetical protein
MRSSRVALQASSTLVLVYVARVPFGCSWGYEEMSKVFHFWCCKSRSRCCNVTKVDLNVADVIFECCGCFFRMLRMLFLTCCNCSSSGCNRFSFMFANRCTHVASVFLRCLKKVSCYWVLQTLNFNVADVEFRCRRHVVLGVMLRRREKRLLMLDVARNTGSQHGRNIVATWSQHGDERRKTHDVGCCKQPRSQHFHNTFATRSQHLPGSL